MFWLIMEPNIDSIYKKDKGEFLGDTKKRNHRSRFLILQ